MLHHFLLRLFQSKNAFKLQNNLLLLLFFLDAQHEDSSFNIFSSKYMVITGAYSEIKLGGGANKWLPC